jgi:hypothetical protein
VVFLRHVLKTLAMTQYPVHLTPLTSVCAADIDACVTAPCGPGATCVDTTGAPANATGRSCQCATGTFYANDTAGCQDFDSCSGNNPCASDTNSNGQCIDLTAPQVGFSCACKPGFSWNQNACLGECYQHLHCKKQKSRQALTFLVCWVLGADCQLQTWPHNHASKSTSTGT